MILEGGRAGGVCIEKSIPRGRGGGSVLKNQFEGGGSELSDQLLDPDVPTLASQDKLKVSPKGLPFVICFNYIGCFRGWIFIQGIELAQACPG